MTNCHNLPRQIPSAIARQIRQRCKFSCVICRDAAVEYHHFDPLFADATSHLPEGITLLCGKHHNYVEHNVLTNRQVAEADQRRQTENQAAMVPLFVTQPFYTMIGSYLSYGQLGPLFVIEDVPILAISSTPEGGVEVAAQFFDPAGKPVVCIEENVVKVRETNWDVTFKGPLLTVWSAARQKVLELLFQPPHVLFVRRLHMYCRGWRLTTDHRGTFRVDHRTPDGQWQPRVDLRESVMVAGGCLHCRGGQMTSTGGLVIDGAYSGARFATLSTKGRYEQIIDEVARQPVFHVLPREGGWIAQLGATESQVVATESDACALAQSMGSEQSFRIVTHRPDGRLNITYSHDP